MPTDATVSVVIGYKDWGLDRLDLCVRTLTRSLSDTGGEVIVSDYGSSDRAAEQVTTEAGGIYVYTQTDGIWSRSRALNAGLSQATGDVLVTTDADMLFTPDTIPTVRDRILADPYLAIVLQCRDLLPGWSADRFSSESIQWDDLPELSRLRPRWGMGGMFAVHRDTYRHIRGFDERMQIYGGEDMDFANRVRRAGVRLEWIDEPNVRMYHMWHPNSRTVADETAEGREAIRKNRAIYLEDQSMHRNVDRWIHCSPTEQPMISVVICSHNRADLLRESILSVLWQSFQDFEIIVVDDGSDDHTEEIVRALQDQDSRIRYFKRPKAGIAASRNYGNMQARGTYIAIHDSDDLMAPRRLEWQLSGIAGGVAGTYGGWADFSDQDGELTPHAGREVSPAALLYMGRVLVHASLMVRTDLAQAVPYDESFTSGSDFNWVSRLLRTGARLAHSGHLHILRRLHGQQVTTVDPSNQKSAAHQTSFSVRQGLNASKTQEMRKKYTALKELPIHEYRRDAHLMERMLPDHLVAERPVVVEIGETQDVSLPAGAVIGEYGFTSGIRIVALADARLEELARLSSQGARWDLVADHDHPLSRLTTLAKKTGLPVAALDTRGASDTMREVVASWTPTQASDTAHRLVMGVPVGSGFDFLTEQYRTLRSGTSVPGLIVTTEGNLAISAIQDFLEGEQP